MTSKEDVKQLAAYLYHLHNITKGQVKSMRLNTLLIRSHYLCQLGPTELNHVAPAHLSSFPNKTGGKIILPFRIKRLRTNSTLHELREQIAFFLVEWEQIAYQPYNSSISFEQKLIEPSFSFEGRTFDLQLGNF